MKWYLTGFRNLLRIKGRASKNEFWWFFLVNYILSIFALIVITYFLIDIHNLAWIFWMIFVLLSTVLIGIRRFHDLGRSGWNMLWSLIPMVGMIILLLAFVQKGDPNENEYGNG